MQKNKILLLSLVLIIFFSAGITFSAASMFSQSELEEMAAAVEPDGKGVPDNLEKYISYYGEKAADINKRLRFNVTSDYSGKYQRVTLNGYINVRGAKNDLDRYLNILGFENIRRNYSIIQTPWAILAFFMAIIGVIYWMSTIKDLQKFFHYLPPLIWCYFIPMLFTTAGVLPMVNSTYGVILDNLLMPVLLLLLISADVPAILRLGPKALGVMLAGTFGIIIGGPIALFLFKGWLPEDAWLGFSALAGSWIGGGANMAAITKIFEVPQHALAPIIVVDTVVGYGWMGVVIALAAYQNKIDHWNKADTGLVAEINERIKKFSEEKARPAVQRDIALIFALAFTGGFICMKLGELLPNVTMPLFFVEDSEPFKVISKFTWGIILVTILGLALSFTKFKKLEEAGASKIGYFGLYLIMASFGAKANLYAVLQTPQYMLAGLVWVMIHALCLFAAVRLLKAPMFFFGVGSQSNIGGPASASVVAVAYQPALAPVGVLLGVFGYIIGTYCAILTAVLMKIVAGG